MYIIVTSSPISLNKCMNYKESQNLHLHVTLCCIDMIK